MPRLHFYVDDEAAKQLRVTAKKANLTLSEYLAELVKRETGAQHQWPMARGHTICDCSEGVGSQACRAPVSIESMNEATSPPGSFKTVRI